MYKQLIDEVEQSKNPQKAKILQNFFKTGKGQYGEGDIFLGIVVPKQRVLAKKYVGLDFAGIGKLVQSPYHEHRMIGLLILTYKYQLAEKLKIKNPKLAEDQQKNIYNFYLAHTGGINNWDLVDVTAPKIVGAYLRHRDKKILFKLAKSKNIWERRIAIISTFDFIYFGNHKTTILLAEYLLSDTHDLIHKAVGWMLREVGKRCGEKYLIEFLNRNATRMPRTMLRYAIERLNHELKYKYMRSK